MLKSDVWTVFSRIKIWAIPDASIRHENGTNLSLHIRLEKYKYEYAHNNQAHFSDYFAGYLLSVPFFRASFSTQVRPNKHRSF